MSYDYLTKPTVLRYFRGHCCQVLRLQEVVVYIVSYPASLTTWFVVWISNMTFRPFLGGAYFSKHQHAASNLPGEGSSKKVEISNTPFFVTVAWKITVARQIATVALGIVVYSSPLNSQFPIFRPFPIPLSNSSLISRPFMTLLCSKNVLDHMTKCN